MKDITSAVADYYAHKLQTHGVTPLGVDWRDENSQENRFAQLHKVFLHAPQASIGDIGCGYGALLPYLRRHGHKGDYHGFDIADEMITAAKAQHADPASAFHVAAQPEAALDYLVASGIFNVRLRFEPDAWRDYMLHTLQQLHHKSRHGFAFNCLTSYSDPERMRDDLFYVDPCWLFDYCKRNFSKQVALLHDYGLYEFTIHVRKEQP